MSIRLALLTLLLLPSSLACKPCRLWHLNHEG